MWHFISKRSGVKRATGILIALVTYALAMITFAAPPDATITLQAKLFQHKTGTFSKDVLAADGPPLGNVATGEDASTATFITVLVALASGVVLPSDSRVRLQVRAAKFRGSAASILLDRTEPLGSVDRGGHTHIGFWLPKTGCRPIQLSATVSVARQPITITTRSDLAFTCGE